MRAPEVIRPELIGRFIDVLLEVLVSLHIRMNGCCSVVAANESSCIRCRGGLAYL